MAILLLWASYYEYIKILHDSISMYRFTWVNTPYVWHWYVLHLVSRQHVGYVHWQSLRYWGKCKLGWTIWRMKLIACLWWSPNYQPIKNLVVYNHTSVSRCKASTHVCSPNTYIITKQMGKTNICKMCYKCVEPSSACDTHTDSHSTIITFTKEEGCVLWAFVIVDKSRKY
jgi:hypothetical protein